MSDRDVGDEDDARPPAPAPHDPIRDLIDEGIADGSILQVDYDVFWFMSYAESMRDCCRTCALEANGEDGS